MSAKKNQKIILSTDRRRGCTGRGGRVASAAPGENGKKKIFLSDIFNTFAPRKKSDDSFPAGKTQFYSGLFYVKY
jgi:hypothetical protein